MKQLGGSYIIIVASLRYGLTNVNRVVLVVTYICIINTRNIGLPKYKMRMLTRVNIHLEFNEKHEHRVNVCD